MLWLLALAALVLLYVFVIRPQLKLMPFFDPFFAAVEPWEQRLWAKSRTVLVARLTFLAGLLVSLHDMLLPLMVTGSFDPLLPPEWLKFMPLAMGLLGLVNEWLRRITSEPLTAKE